VRAGPELEPGSEAARSDIPWLTLLALASRVSLADSTVLDTPPTATGSTDLLVSLIQSLPRPLPDSAPAENGAPHVLILAASGQRCADLVRELRPLLGPLEKSAPAAGGKQGEKKSSKQAAKKAKVEAPPKPRNGEVAKVRLESRCKSLLAVVLVAG